MEQHGHVAASGGARVGYTVYGPASDTPICFCPGLGGTQLGYAADARYFAERGYRAITFDLRGFGESTPPDVLEPSAFTLGVLAEDFIALLDHMNVPQAHYVGNSLGGVIGLEAIRSHPQRIRSFTSFGTTYHLSLPKLTVSMQYWMNRILGPKRLPAFVASNATGFDEARSIVQEMFEGYPVLAGRCIGYGICRYDYREVARNWGKPILLIQGGLDSSINRQLASTLDALSACDHFRLRTVPEAGHFTNLDRPDDVRRLIMESLEGA